MSSNFNSLLTPLPRMIVSSTFPLRWSDTDPYPCKIVKFIILKIRRKIRIKITDVFKSISLLNFTCLIFMGSQKGTVTNLRTGLTGVRLQACAKD